MTKEQEFLLSVLKKAVQGESVQTMPDAPLDWPELLQEARDQAVWLVFFDALTPVQAQLPMDMDAAELEAVSILSSNLNTEQAQQELTGVLEEREDPYVILKGLTSAAWYPKPETRLLGDVDFLMPVELHEQIIARLQERGYIHQYFPGLHHHNLDKQDLHLELHKEISGIPKETGREHIEDFMRSVYSRRQRLHTQLGSYYGPGDAHQALIQLLHLEDHTLSGGVGLRQIMDWACFMNGNGQKAFWQEELLPLLKKIGLYNFAAVLTKMASLYLGSFCPDWAEYVEEDLCRDMMEDILASGNFSCKDTRRNHSFSFLPDWEGQDMKGGKLSRLYKSLRRVVVSQDPRLEGRPLATFWAMVCKAVRYVALYLIGKRPDLAEVSALAEERESVFRRLKMFETEE